MNLSLFGIITGVTISIMFAVYMIAGINTGLKRDTTDDPTGQRSGLTVYTDHETKLQYLSTVMGGLTPRIDKHGRHMQKEL